MLWLDDSKDIQIQSLHGLQAPLLAQEVVVEVGIVVWQGICESVSADPQLWREFDEREEAESQEIKLPLPWDQTVSRWQSYLLYHCFGYASWTKIFSFLKLQTTSDQEEEAVTLAKVCKIPNVGLGSAQRPWRHSFLQSWNIFAALSVWMQNKYDPL